MPQIAFRIHDIPDGGMRGFDAGDGKILVVRDGGDVRAFNGTCPHAGASLAEGVRCAGRVVCPWHHAAFATDDGTLLEPPAMEKLQQYEVRKRDGEFIVDTASEVDSASERSLSPSAPKQSDQRVVIVGAGAGAFMAAQTLRTLGHAGSITLIRPEAVAPYDRTMLSKGFLGGEADKDSLLLGGAGWAQQHSLTTVTGEAVAIDREARRVRLADGSDLPYDRLIVATGAEPTDGGLPGASLQGVHTLRSLADAETLRDAAKGKRVVIVGTGFIGMETASMLASKGGASSVTVLGQGDRIMSSMLGPKSAAALARRHATYGVDIRLGVQVDSLTGEDGKVNGVLLSGDRVVQGDIVLLALGVHPRSSLLGDLADASGALITDETMHLTPEIQAIGDIAKAPTSLGDFRIEHWRVAMQHGMVAAEAIVQGSATEPMSHRVPFFWTMQCDKSIRYVGHAVPNASTCVWGNLDDFTFIEFRFEEGKVVAAVGCGKDTELAAVEECLRLNVTLAEDRVRRGPFDLLEELSRRARQG